MTIESLVTTMMPSIVVGIFMAYFNNKQKKHDKAVEDRNNARKNETLLQLELEMAIGKLSLASAVALKRGYANGEVEEGMKAFEKANAKYQEFLNAQAVERINGD